MCSPLLLLSRRLLVLVPPVFLPLTLIVKRSKLFLKKSKPSCSSCTSHLGRRLSDRPHRTADFKTQNIIGPHRTRLTLPSPTVPRSGLLKSWKGFQDDYRNIWFLLCTFSALFRLRLARFHFLFAPFDLDHIIIFAATFLTLVVVALNVVHLTTIQ